MTALEKEGESTIEVGTPLKSALQTVDAPQLVREKAFQSLRHAIITGALPPGTRLVERELCEALGVSRTSIRETLRRLEAERLIEGGTRKGPTVARVSRLQAQQIYDLRAYLEGKVADKFAREATDAEVAELRRLFHAFERALKHDGIVESVDVMAAFYGHMSSVSGLDVFSDLLAQLTARVSFLRATSMSQPNRTQHSLDELDALVDAIERRDADHARSAAIEHVERAASAALAGLRD